MVMKIKVPLKDVEKEDVCSRIEAKLRADRDNAYTIQGLMVELFKVRESQIHSKPFKDWERGLPATYTKVRLCLEKMREQGKVHRSKSEKAWVYWWARE